MLKLPNDVDLSETDVGASDTAAVPPRLTHMHRFCNNEKLSLETLGTATFSNDVSPVSQQRNS